MWWRCCREESKSDVLIHVSRNSLFLFSHSVSSLNIHSVSPLNIHSFFFKSFFRPVNLSSFDTILRQKEYSNTSPVVASPSCIHDLTHSMSLIRWDFPYSASTLFFIPSSSLSGFLFSLPYWRSHFNFLFFFVSFFFFLIIISSVNERQTRTTTRVASVSQTKTMMSV